MVYACDQCEQCGAPRVARSTLCADCLVGEQKRLLLRSTGYELEIKKLQEKVDKLSLLSDRLLDHIIRESLYEGDFERRIREMIQEAARVKR